MTDGSEQKEKDAASPSGRKPLTLTRTASAGTVRQSFSHGRTKQVAVEVREKRSINRPGQAGAAGPQPGPGVPPPLKTKAAEPAPAPVETKAQPGGISDVEARRREEAVRRAQAEKAARDARQQAEDAQRRALEDAQRKAIEEQEAHEAETAARHRAEQEEAEAAAAAEEKAAARKEALQERVAANNAQRQAGAEQSPQQPREQQVDVLSELGGRVKSARKAMPVAPVKPTKKGEPKRREGRLTLDMVEREVAGDDDRVRSLAAYRRAQQKEKERRAKLMGGGEREQIKREVIIPETITVQELSNRMAVRVADIIKFMMRQGQMMKQGDELDADTA